MKRLHVNISVSDLDSSVGFYRSLFDAEPTVLKEDYAKWMLDDPRVNFAITTRGQRKGLDHLGIQVENDGELDEVYSRLKTAGAPVIEEARPPAATPTLRKAGFSIPTASPGKPF